MTGSRAEEWELERLMRAGRLYAIIDACDQPEVPPRMARQGASRAVSLYAGLYNEGDWAIGAYLALVDPSLLHWIEETLPADSWGVLVESELALMALLRRLQRFVFVEIPEGGPGFLRFYDPRVLVAYGEWYRRSHRERSLGRTDGAHDVESLLAVGRFAIMREAGVVEWLPPV